MYFSTVVKLHLQKFAEEITDWLDEICQVRDLQGLVESKTFTQIIASYLAKCITYLTSN